MLKVANLKSGKKFAIGWQGVVCEAVRIEEEFPGAAPFHAGPNRPALPSICRAPLWTQSIARLSLATLSFLALVRNQS